MSEKNKYIVWGSNDPEDYSEVFTSDNKVKEYIKGIILDGGFADNIKIYKLVKCGGVTQKIDIKL